MLTNVTEKYVYSHSHAALVQSPVHASQLLFLPFLWECKTAA